MEIFVNVWLVSRTGSLQDVADALRAAIIDFFQYFEVKSREWKGLLSVSLIVHVDSTQRVTCVLNDVSVQRHAESVAEQLVFWSADVKQSS